MASRIELPEDRSVKIKLPEVTCGRCGTTYEGVAIVGVTDRYGRFACAHCIVAVVLDGRAEQGGTLSG